MMNHHDLPERWKLKLIEYLKSKGIEDRSTLLVYDFPSNKKVQIKFQDKSFVEFMSAFVICAPEFREVGVFTEHCGYHIFFLDEENIKMVSI